MSERLSMNTASMKTEPASTGPASKKTKATSMERVRMNLTEQLTNYAAYHRDRRNIATHFVGIPMIVLSVAALLSRPSIDVGLPLSPALPALILAAAFYLALDFSYGLIMTALLALALWFGASLASLPTIAWLGTSLGMFVAGWIIQFIGHAFEGKKPAFVDDLTASLVGPLFLVAEVSFALGLRTELAQEIESKVGPTIIRPAR